MRKRSVNRFVVVVCILILIGEISAGTSYAQKINRRLPGVYLSFKEFIAKTPDPAYPSEGARLLIHNNTKWPIIFWTHYDPTVAGEAVSYVIEKQDGSRETRMYVDIVNRRTLLPGKTINLVVPRDDFPKGSKIYVEFVFSWELRNDDRIRDEAVHRAYFLSSSLPDWPNVVTESKVKE